MATVRTIANKNGSVTILVRWEKPRVAGNVNRERGERRFVIPSGATKKLAREVTNEAEAFRREVERSGGAEAYEASRITVAELCARFLGSKERRVSPATYRSYRSTIEAHVLPWFGTRALGSITAYEIEGWVQVKQDQAGAQSSAATWFTHLRMVFRKAVDWDLIRKSPCDGVDAPPAGPGRERVLTAHEEASFVAAIAGDPYEALWRVMLSGGLRVGEALALRWCDVDLDVGTVTVCRTVTKAASGGLTIREGTKTGPGRVVAVNDRVVQAFRLRKDSVCPRFAAEPCFGTSGNWMRPAAAGKRLATIRTRAGLPADITAHTFRHHHITVLRNEGYSYKAIALRVGHKSLVTTLGYDHPGSSQDRDMAEAVG